MILITGGSGVIGRHLSFVGTYLGRRPQTGRICAEGDLRTDTPDLTGVDTVIHLAQSRKYKDGPEGWNDVWGVNADSTFRLLDASRKAGVTHFIYASTGGSGHDMYAASKRAGEVAVEAFSGEMDTLILRFYAVYGEGQREDALIPTLAGRVREGRDIQNGICTAPCYAGDAAAAIERAVSMRDRGIRTVSGPEIMDAHDIATVIGDYYDTAPVLTDGVPVNLYRHSDYPTHVTFAEGFRRMCDASSVPGGKRLRGERQRLSAGAGKRRRGDEMLRRETA